MITRTSLADEIDLLDADIKVLNDSKTAAFTAYREQLIAAGVAKENVKKEIDATKAAIKRRRATTKDEDAVLENEALADEIYIEITAKSRAPRACVENIEEFDAETGEILEERRSDAGLNIVTKHTEITTSPETAEGETGMVLGTGRERPLSIGLHTDGDPEARFETASLHQDQQMDRATEGSFETGSEAAEKGREAIPAGSEGADLSHAGAGESPATSPEKTADQAGGKHDVATDNDIPAVVPTYVTGEGAANTALPASDVYMEDVPPSPMKSLPYAHCFPELPRAAYEKLGEDIAFRGMREPIIRMGDVIVDGWARYNICRTLGISYPTKNYSGNDVLLDVIEWQRASRNFTPAQEKKISADLAKAMPDRADDIMAAFGLAEELEAAE